jgi:hypothetical protein
VVTAAAGLILLCGGPGDIPAAARHRRLSRVAESNSSGFGFHTRRQSERTLKASSPGFRTSAFVTALTGPAGSWTAGMKQKDARTLMIQEWDRWLQIQSIAPREATGRDSLKFYFELQDKSSPLLDFQTRGRDKWDVIHGWLMGQRRALD